MDGSVRGPSSLTLFLRSIPSKTGSFTKHPPSGSSGRVHPTRGVDRGLSSLRALSLVLNLFCLSDGVGSVARKEVTVNRIRKAPLFIFLFSEIFLH